MVHSSPFRARRPGRISRQRLTTATAIAIAIASTLLAGSPAEAQYTRASVATDGSQGNGASRTGALSGNGRFVLFSSDASNLVADDTNGVSDVFVRDLVGNTTTRVSVSSTGAQGTGPSYAERISDDGTIVIFTSEASLVADDVGQSCAEHKCLDVYAHNRTTGVTTRVSVATDGTQANSESKEPDLSADGRYVVFASDASNLTPGDTNGASDVFLRDLTAQTTTRVSEGPEGQGVTGSASPAISADGKVVAFAASGLAFTGLGPDDGPCDRIGCTRLFVKTRETGAVVRFPAAGARVMRIVLDGDGSVAALTSTFFYPTANAAIDYFVETRDLTSGQQTEVGKTFLDPFDGLAVSRDGRNVAASSRFTAKVYDATNGTNESLIPIAPLSDSAAGMAFDATGRYVAFSTAVDTLAAGDTNGLHDAFVYDRDPDGDGMPSYWETQYGFDPNSPADATLDADGDGVTNADEFLLSSHPKAPHKQYFAEGATNAFFSTQFHILVPGDQPASVMVRMLGANGKIKSQVLGIGGKRHYPFQPRFFFGTPDAVYSTVIESDQPVVVDRLMEWDRTGYGSHLEGGVDAPGGTWYLAEGATGGGFSLFYLLQNPGDTDATVTVDYLRPNQAPVITKNYPVAAHSRYTVDVAGEDPGLSGGDVSAKVTSNAAIVVERAMYRSRPGQPFAAGHAGAGIAAPATRWFLAEGATGFFDEYVLIANAESDLAKVKLTFLLPDAASTFTDTVDVLANSRFTLDLKSYPALAATPVSVIVESTNSVPVVVERAMWWPAGGDAYEASLSAGVTTTGTKWAIGAGQQGGGRQTYVLVANTDPARDGQAKITLVFMDGDPVETTIDVPRNGRATLDVGTLLTQAFTRDFSIIVEGLDGLPIVVERSLYYNADGVVFAAGATSVATNITPVP